MKLVFVWNLVLVLVLGCQNKTTPVPEDQLTQPEKTSVPEAPFQPGTGPLRLTAVASGLERPHQYSVDLQWKSGEQEPSVFYIVKRSDWNEGRVIPPGQSFYKDIHVTEDQEYLYQVQMLNGSKNLSTDWVKIKIPRDKVFSSESTVQIGELTEFHRIFILNQARLSWQGEELKIKADEIISEQAVFEAFSPENKNAPVGQPGKHGGLLKIHARKLRGTLLIRGDGQNGGPGTTGTSGTKGSPGGRGPDTFLHWGSPNPVPDGAYLHHGYWFYCDPPRPSGGQGGQGGEGGKGNPGLSGGNSAKVHVEIGDAKDGEVLITQKPGLGGEPGLGGPGGPGGPGGIPGEIDWQSHASKMPGGADLNLFHQCQPSQGPEGGVGPTGPLGERGEDGFQAPYCLKLGSSQIGLCP